MEMMCSDREVAAPSMAAEGTVLVIFSIRQLQRTRGPLHCVLLLN